MKTYSSTYVYTKYPNFEKNLINFIMKSEEVDKTSEKFEDILYQFKQRQVSDSLSKILMSKNVVLLYNTEGNTKALKVITCKDLKGDNKKKVFIDCSDLIYYDKESGIYKCENINVLISYVVNAMVSYIYTMDESRIINNNEIIEYSTSAFAKLFTSIIDRLCKVSVSGNNKAKCLYLSSTYYMVNVLGLAIDSSTTKNIAKRISGLSDREIDVVKILIEDDCYQNIKTFVTNISNVIKNPKLNIDIFLEKWMYIYGTGTVFAVEYFPAFSAMLTDAYVQAYINNQNQIETVAGKDMVQYTKTILRIGSGSL